MKKTVSLTVIIKSILHDVGETLAFIILITLFAIVSLLDFIEGNWIAILGFTFGTFLIFCLFYLLYLLKLNFGGLL